MLIYEYKLAGNKAQYDAIDEAIRITQFIRNKCLYLWMQKRGFTRYDLNVSCTQLAKEFPFVARLNSQARQAAAERAWSAISRFYKNCRTHKPGKKGYPRYVPIIVVEPAFTSQDCSACGTRIKKSLSVRTHICSGCGLVLDRDHNVALNILQKALYRTEGHSETGIPERIQNASGQTSSTRYRKVRAGKVTG